MRVKNRWREYSESRRWPRPRSGPHWILNVLLAVTLSGLLAGLALAGGSPEIGAHVIGGGGGRQQAGEYSLASTIGQPVAGRTDADGLALCSGFQCLAVALAEYEVFLPVVLGGGGERLNH